MLSINIKLLIVCRLLIIVIKFCQMIIVVNLSHFSNWLKICIWNKVKDLKSGIFSCQCWFWQITNKSQIRDFERDECVFLFSNNINSSNSSLFLSSKKNKERRMKKYKFVAIIYRQMWRQIGESACWNDYLTKFSKPWNCASILFV